MIQTLTMHDKRTPHDPDTHNARQTYTAWSRHPQCTTNVHRMIQTPTMYDKRTPHNPDTYNARQTYTTWSRHLQCTTNVHHMIQSPTIYRSQVSLLRQRVPEGPVFCAHQTARQSVSYRDAPDTRYLEIHKLYSPGKFSKHAAMLKVCAWRQNCWAWNAVNGMHVIKL